MEIGHIHEYMDKDIEREASYELDPEPAQDLAKLVKAENEQNNYKKYLPEGCRYNHRRKGKNCIEKTGGIEPERKGI